MPNAPLQQIHVSAYSEADADMLRRFRELTPRQGVNRRLLELIRREVERMEQEDGHE